MHSSDGLPDDRESNRRQQVRPFVLVDRRVFEEVCAGRFSGLPVVQKLYFVLAVFFWAAFIAAFVVMYMDNGTISRFLRIVAAVGLVLGLFVYLLKKNIR